MGKFTFLLKSSKNFKTLEYSCNHQYRVRFVLSSQKFPLLFLCSHTLPLILTPDNHCCPFLTTVLSL